MTRTTLAFIAAGLLLAGAPVFGFAGATHDPNSEKRADCENADNQGWIGYNSTRTARYLYENASSGRANSGLGSQADGVINQHGNRAIVDNCEGEHWDGQDTVNNESRNEPTTTADPACTPKVTETATTDFSVTNCQRADINENTDGPLGRAPLAFRVSGKGNGNGGYQEVYVGLDIMLVGRAAVYAGTCSDGTSGLEGAASCDSAASPIHGRQSRTGVYLRDNTPGNVLATIVSAAGITRGEAGEGDCTQEQYQLGVEEGNRKRCTRDNTAVTVDLLLP